MLNFVVFLTLFVSACAARDRLPSQTESGPLRAIPVEEEEEIPSWAETLSGIDSYKEKDQLQRRRYQDPRSVDACSAQFGVQRTFGDAIRLGLEQSLTARRYPFNDFVREVVMLPQNSLQRPTSLISQPFCPVTKASLEHMLGTDKNGVSYVPRDGVVEQIARFTRTLEGARRQAVRGNVEARADFVKAMTVFMGCLAYAESLSTPGDPGDKEKEKYDERFRDYVHSTGALRATFGFNVQRPAGVIFSRDRNGAYFTQINKIATNADLTDEDKKTLTEALQSGNASARRLVGKLAKAKNLAAWTAAEKESLKQALGTHFEEWLSVGLYQFLPSSDGNIIPCVDSWNETYRWGGCQIPKTEAGTARALLSPGQGFNAFCGAQKIVHAMSTQTNTTSALGTDIANHRGDKLLAPEDRCVTLYGRGGRGRMYAHFGPLRNSVMNRKTPEGVRIPDNMENLFGCIQSTLPPGLVSRYGI